MRVVFRVDASIEIGSGHLMRSMTLAEQLRGNGADVVFACRDLPGGMFELLSAKGYQSAKLPLGEEGIDQQQFDATATITMIDQLVPHCVDWLVVDHYGFDFRWERIVRPYVHRLMVIDDLANRQHDCDLLLDQNYYRNLEHRYRDLLPKQCVKLLGPSYVLLRPEFYELAKRSRARDGTVRRILVSFGGSDPANQTLKVVEAIYKLSRQTIEVDVVVGMNNPNQNAIRALCAELPNVVFHCQVSNMAELINSADIGIGAGGASMWERCYLGLPTITVVLADNQLDTTEDLAKLGAIEYLGRGDVLIAEDYARAIVKLIDHPKYTKRIGDAARRVVQPSCAIVSDEMYRLASETTHPLPKSC